MGGIRRGRVFTITPCFKAPEYVPHTHTPCVISVSLSFRHDHITMKPICSSPRLTVQSNSQSVFNIASGFLHSKCVIKTCSKINWRSSCSVPWGSSERGLDLQLCPEHGRTRSGVNAWVLKQLVDPDLLIKWVKREMVCAVHFILAFTWWDRHIEACTLRWSGGAL